MFVVSVFCRKVDENSALLGCYAACSGNSYQSYGTTYRSHIQGSKFKKLLGFLTVVTNFGKELPLRAI